MLFSKAIICIRNYFKTAAVSMEKASQLSVPAIFAIGNAPTALARLCELKASGQISPIAVVRVPTDFVNVVEVKELLIQSSIRDRIRYTLVSMF